MVKPRNGGQRSALESCAIAIALRDNASARLKQDREKQLRVAMVHTRRDSSSVVSHCGGLRSIKRVLFNCIAA